MFSTHLNGNSALASPAFGKRHSYATAPTGFPSRTASATGRERIKDEIDAKCRSGYAYWRIGLTHDVHQARKHWGAPNHGAVNWSSWVASSLSEARKIEQHFISRGMQGTPGDDLSIAKPVHVYVFWLGSPAG
jgi:hypothetical protein